MPKEVKEVKKEEKEVKETKKESNFIVGEPTKLKPQDLALVIKVGDKASSAQREYARIINGYAYANLDKYEQKKEVLLKRLEFLADYEVPDVESYNTSLTVKNDNGITGTPYRFRFMTDPVTKQYVDVVINIA